MINLEKWKTKTDEEKLTFVDSVLTISNTDCITKNDWLVMCNFLLGKVKAREEE